MPKPLTKPQKNVAIGSYAIVFGILYWPLESIIHVVFFQDATFMSLLFHPEPNEAWMRVLISAAFIFFGRLVNKLINENFETTSLLYQRKHRLRSVINTIPSAYVCINIGGEIVDWNPMAEKLFGWTREEAINESVLDMIVPEQFHDLCQNEMSKFRINRSMDWLEKSFIATVKNKSKKEFDVKISGAPIYFDGYSELYAFIRPIDAPAYYNSQADT